MEQKKKYPIGIQTFAEIIGGGYFYVDKTDLVYRLISEGKYYFLSRPRRFGKSLLITTLEAYFQGKKDLFKGLVIDNYEKDWVSYPVFHIDFSGETYTTVDKVVNRVESYLTQWETVYGANAVEKGVGNRMRGLLQRACDKTGKQCVILIDEYDKPLTDTIGKTEVQEEIRAILQGLYGVLKNADRNIKFAFLTGVTRYGKLGIFSANNNPNDISTSKEFSAICGITEEEIHQYFDEDIKSLANEYDIGVEDMYAKLKNKYDGYHFSRQHTGIYNPFSLLNALCNRELKSYWFATGTPSYLTLLLKKADFDPTQLDGEIYAMEETISSFGNGESNIIAALYQSGYLTIKNVDDYDTYTLVVPNEEVANGLTRYLIPDYTNTNIGRFDPDLVKLQRLVRAGDADGMMVQLQDIIEQIPFESNEPKMIEANFRNIVYLMIRAAGFSVHVELPKLGGRLDVCFETEKFAYIIECKRDVSADEALKQIDEKKYAALLSHSGKKLYKVGANFSAETKNLAEWKVKDF